MRSESDICCTSSDSFAHLRTRWSFRGGAVICSEIHALAEIVETTGSREGLHRQWLIKTRLRKTHRTISSHCVRGKSVTSKHSPGYENVDASPRLLLI